MAASKIGPAQGAQRRSGRRRNALGPERSVRQTRTDHCDCWARQGMGVPSAFRTRQSARKVQPRSRRRRGCAGKGPRRADRTPGILDLDTLMPFAGHALETPWTEPQLAYFRGLRDVDLPQPAVPGAAMPAMMACCGGTTMRSRLRPTRPPRITWPTMSRSMASSFRPSAASTSPVRTASPCRTS